MAVEYLRANAGFLALPWGTLAQAQHKNLAILQFASIAGEPGVTFLVALGNAAIAEIILNVLSRSSAAPLWKREGQREGGFLAQSIGKLFLLLGDECLL